MRQRSQRHACVLPTVGLGLALVHQIARHHGGEVQCVPRDGGDTCFEVTLRTTPG